MSYAVAFTDEEIGVVLDAARQLDLDDRDAFLVAVTDALRSAARAGELGPAVVYRVCAETQRRFLRPPELGRRSVGKWNR